MIESLVLALSGFASFGSITVVILLLISGNSYRNWIGYVLWYSLSYALIGIAVIVLWFTKLESGPKEPSIFFPILYIVLGSILLLIWLRNLFKPKVRSKNTHSFPIFSSLDTLTPLKSFGFGIMVSVINFKNLTLFLSAISIVHLSNLELYLKIINVLLVTFIFCFSLIIPILIVLLFPKKSKKILLTIKDTIETHIHTLWIIFPLFFWFILILSGIMKLVMIN